jgi:hypothetical protein
MKENMTVSGTHDTDPWNFVECAMAGTREFTEVKVYYFYQRCEANSNIDSCFQPFLDTSIRGNTVSLLGDNEDNNIDGLSLKKRAAPQDEHEHAADSIIQNFLAQGNTILKHLSDAAQECKVEASNVEKKRKFLARLEAAKVLGNREELKS